MYYINSPTSMSRARTQGTYSRSVKTDLLLKHSVVMGHSNLEYVYYEYVLYSVTESTRDRIQIYDVNVPSLQRTIIIESLSDYV